MTCTKGSIYILADFSCKVCFRFRELFIAFTVFKGIKEDAFVPEKKVEADCNNKNEIHVKEKARQAKLNTIVNWCEKGALSSFLLISKIKEEIMLEE